MTRLLTSLALGVAIAFAPLGPAEAQSTLETVKKRGTMIVGVRKDVPSFGMTDAKGEVVGFDIEIAKGIAAKLGVGIQLEPVTAATRTALLQQGRVDLLVATLTQYRSRDSSMDFSVGYFYSPQTLLVPKDSKIRGMADMDGKRAGTTIGAGAVEAMKKAQPKITVQTFNGYPESFLALQRGLVDAVGADNVILASLRAKAPNPKDWTIVPDVNFGGGFYCVGVRENDSTWLDAINHALHDMWRDGTWRQAYDKWIGPGTDLDLKFEELGFTMYTWN